MKTSSTCLAVLLAVSAHHPAAAQAPHGDDRQAQADYQAGVAARAKGDSRAAAAEFRKAIELDSTFIEAHIAYIAMKIAG